MDAIVCAFSQSICYRESIFVLERDLTMTTHFEQRKVGSVPGRKEDGAVSTVAATKAAVDPIPGNIRTSVYSCRHVNCKFRAVTDETYRILDSTKAAVIDRHL